MKFFTIIAIISLVIFCGCEKKETPQTQTEAQTQTQQPTEDITAAVTTVMNNYLQAYSSRDIERTASCFTPNPGMINYGTGADEKYIGIDGIKAALTRDFAQSESASMELNGVQVSSSGNVAWLASDCVYKGKTKNGDIVINGRLTAVLEKQDDKWLIAQTHFSAPLSTQEIGQSFPKSKTASAVAPEPKKEKKTKFKKSKKSSKYYKSRTHKKHR